jgi:hypothetical protein
MILVIVTSSDVIVNVTGYPMKGARSGWYRIVIRLRIHRKQNKRRRLSVVKVVSHPSTLPTTN